MSSFYFDNAITWAQYRLRGGLRSVLTVSLGYSVLVCGTIAVIYGTVDVGNRGHAMMAWSFGLLLLQCLFLLILGSVRVRMSIHADILSRQIESHRMMPLTPRQAIVGYILGANVHFIALAICTFAIGSVTSMGASLRFQTWLIANLFLLVFAIFSWSMSALTAFAPRGFFWLLIVFFLVGLFSQGLLFVWAPATLMLSTPLMGALLFGNTVPRMLVDALLYALVAQLILSALCICGAARKYDLDDDAISLPAPFTLIGLGLWVWLSIYAARHMKDIFGDRFFNFEYTDLTSPMTIGAIATSILFAMTVMASVAWTGLLAKNRSAASKASRLAVPFPVCLLLCVAAICAIPFVLPPTAHWIGLAGVGILSTMCLCQAYLLMRTFYGWVRYPNIVIALLMGALWLGPLIADLIYYSAVEPQVDPRMDFLGPGSPIGLLMQIYSTKPPDFQFGLAIQLAALCAFALIFIRRKRALGRRAKSSVRISRPTATPTQTAPTSTEQAAIEPVA